MKLISLLTFIMSSSIAFAGGGSSIGLGNPASEHCQKLGGVTVIEETPAGQVGICAIDEWTLFLKMDEAGLTVDHQYPDLSMPNPASVNCADAGGELSIVEEEGGQRGICSVEEWHLFQLFNYGN